MPQLVSKPLPWFKQDPKQVRKTFDDESLRPLGESLRKKQLQPLFCQPDGTIIAGERRFRAAKLVGLATLEVKIADELLPDSQVTAAQLIENLQREGLSGYEQWTGAAEWLCLNPGAQLKDLAEAINLTPSGVTRIMSPGKCIEAVQIALRDGQLGITDTYAISKLPESEQAGLLALKLSGVSRDQIEAAGRKSRANNGTPTVKLNRAACRLESGAQVVVSGEGLDLDAVLEALADAAKQARKIRDQGGDVKSFNALMKAKAAG